MAPNNRFRTGSTYTLGELAELARRGLEGRTQTEAAAYLNAHHPSNRGRFTKQQISNALRNPVGNPGLILLLVEAFTDYKMDQQPRYLLERRK